MVAHTLFLTRNWFAFLVLCSALFVLITGASYALEGNGTVGTLLFWIGLGGENNVGAWWSGMLLLVAAVLAFDGYCNVAKPLAERRGWAALAIALTLLSFDEVASLHEYVGGIGVRYLVPFGLVGIGLVAYSLIGLRRGGVRRRATVQIVMAFGLLATVPLHEAVQHNVDWNSPLAYGVRALLEEGTEISAMLLLIAVTAPNSVALLHQEGELFAVATRYRGIMLAGGLVLVPVLAAAAFVLPYPPGPANWLMQGFYLGCLLLAVRSGLRPTGELALSAMLAIPFYAVAGASSAVSLRWDPVVLGTAVSLRGVCCAFLLIAALWMLRWTGRGTTSATVALAAITVLAAVLWPASQLVWSALPALVALWFYGIESKTIIAVTASARARQVHAEPPAAAPIAASEVVSIALD